MTLRDMPTTAYFDHNATTRIDDAVLQAMLPFLREQCGNASSRHALGSRARHSAVLRQRVERGLSALGAHLIGTAAARLHNTVCFGFENIDGEASAIELNKAGFALTSGSACSGNGAEPGATLAGNGCGCRLGADNSMQQVNGFLSAVATVVDRLRRRVAVAV